MQLTFKLGISETISVNKLCLDLPKIITTFKLLPVEFERMRKKNYITTTFQSKLQSTVVKNKENWYQNLKNISTYNDYINRKMYIYIYL